MYMVSTAQKQYIREQYRRYFETKEPDCILYLFNIVSSLWSIKEVNNMRKILGQYDYEKLEKNLEKYQKLYNYSISIRQTIIKMQDLKSDSETLREKIKIQNRYLAEISTFMPIIRADIIKAYFLLINETDMRNVAIPKQEFRIRSPTQQLDRQYGGY